MKIGNMNQTLGRVLHLYYSLKRSYKSLWVRYYHISILQRRKQHWESVDLPRVTTQGLACPRWARPGAHRLSSGEPCMPSAVSAAAAKPLQSCPTPCDPIDGSVNSYCHLNLSFWPSLNIVKSWDFSRIHLTCSPAQVHIWVYATWLKSWLFI